MSRVRLSRAALLSGVAVLVLVAAGPAAAAKITVQDGVMYGTAKVGAPAVGTAALKLDLYTPAAKAKRARPVVVIIHGGGFAKQSRKDPGIVEIGRAMAERGIVAAAIDYRLLGQAPVPSSRVEGLTAALPAAPLSAAISSAVDDTLTATDYLRQNASRLGIDPDRLGLVGSSAGGITADQIGYALDDHGVRRPPVRFVASLWGGILVSAPAALGALPADQLEHGEPPLFAVHGDADTTLPVAMDDELVARAREQHVTNAYYRIPGGVHGYDGSKFFTYRTKGGPTPFQRLLAFAGARLR
jgi:acetyl esterase/lipase